MDVWLALDPETESVIIQGREFDDGSFPRGRRGLGWPIRTAKIEKADFNKILSGELGQDFIVELWEGAA